MFEVDKINLEQGRRIAWVDYDFMKVPPIPVYRIPEDIQLREWKYMLSDGNKRWYFWHATAWKVAAILLEPDEKIKIEGWGVAPFRHINDSKTYERILGIYQHQQQTYVR